MFSGLASLHHATSKCRMLHLRILWVEAGDLDGILSTLELPQLAMVCWRSKDGRSQKLTGSACRALQSAAVMEIWACAELPAGMQARCISCNLLVLSL